MPNAQSRREATQRLAQSLMRNDPVAAASWRDTLPANERRDAALRGFIAVGDPPNAGQWALGIKNQQSRNELLTSVARDWIKQDPEAPHAGWHNPLFRSSCDNGCKNPDT